MTPVNYQRVKAMLAPALQGGKRRIEREIEKGVSKAYLTSHRNLAVVVRPEGRELVYVAVAGSNLKLSVDEMIAFAKTRGFSSIRFHTKHPERLKKGLAGVAVELVEKRQSLFSTEYVYRFYL